MTSPEVISQIEKATSQLEMAVETQTAVNDLNNEITTIVLNQMEQYIPHRVITVPPRERKGRHSEKPWWNDELSTMWLIVDAAEKRYLKAQGALRCKLKTYYVRQPKKFSKYVQRAKRIIWHKIQDELVSLNERNKPEFWKKTGRMGARNQKVPQIPFEVVLGNDSTSKDPETVLKVWADAFSGLLNPDITDSENCDTDHDDNVAAANDGTALNVDITLREVAEAVGMAHKHKAPGVDGIPADALKTPRIVVALHKLFSICF